MVKQPTLHRRDSVNLLDRQNSGGDQARLGWSVAPETGAGVLAGYCTWNGNACPPKMLDYEEVIAVLRGTFGIRFDDETVLTGVPGDVLHIPKGTTVSYFGENAEVFFAITRPDSLA